MYYLELIKTILVIAKDATEFSVQFVKMVSNENNKRWFHRAFCTEFKRIQHVIGFTEWKIQAARYTLIKPRSYFVQVYWLTLFFIFLSF